MNSKKILITSSGQQKSTVYKSFKHSAQEIQVIHKQLNKFVIFINFVI